MTKKQIIINEGITYPTLRTWVKTLLASKPHLFTWEEFARSRVLPPHISSALKSELCIQ